MPDPGVTGLPSGLLGLIAVVAGIGIVLLVGWLIQRSEQKGQAERAAKQAAEARATAAATASTTTPSAPKRPAQPAQPDETDELLAAATAAYRTLVVQERECKALRDWMRRFDVTSQSALVHQHGESPGSISCPACHYEALELTTLKLEDLDPGPIDDPWSELVFDSEEEYAELAASLSEEELDEWARGAAWQNAVLRRIPDGDHTHQTFLRRRIDYLRSPEALGPKPAHTHSDSTQHPGCPACRYEHYRRPLT
ncbi:hypothetical protein [Agromyces humi]|uniref:hypothetical protein n=1 Tax=Agromyces humi TaxID=1766800 RepID=UPI00135C432A|nr:hypothetical protein [Agromyces humi]